VTFVGCKDVSQVYASLRLKIESIDGTATLVGCEVKYSISVFIYQLKCNYLLRVRKAVILHGISACHFD
jgi:hypothetical protein